MSDYEILLGELDKIKQKWAPASTTREHTAKILLIACFVVPLCMRSSGLSKLLT